MKLILVDATNAVMRRAMVATDMTATQAADDAGERVLRAAYDLDATHMMAVFDDPNDNWRYDVYDDYKGAKSKPGVSTKPYSQAMWRVMEGMGIHRVFVKGFEADDKIATIAKRVAGSGREVLTLSSDNDLVQLMSENVRIVQYAPAGVRPWLLTRNGEWCMTKFGVRPDQYVDYLTLVGGKNAVPGVPKIGAKTAEKLLAEHGDMMTAFERGRIPDEHLGWAVIARTLHKLDTDVPVPPVAPTHCAVPKRAA